MPVSCNTWQPLSLDEVVNRTHQACFSSSPDVTIAKLPTTFPYFDQIIAIQSLRGTVTQYLQHQMEQKKNEALLLAAQYSPPALQSVLLSEWLTAEDWECLQGCFRQTFLNTHDTLPTGDNKMLTGLSTFAGNVNVLCFDKDIDSSIPVTVAEASYYAPVWSTALDNLETFLQKHASECGADDNDSSPFLVASTNSREWEGSASRGGLLDQSLSCSFFLSCLAQLLEQNPEAVTQLGEWRTLIWWLVVSAYEDPHEGSQVILQYFRITGPQQRHLLLLKLMLVVQTERLQPSQEIRRPLDFFLYCILCCIEGLPENWMGLQDSEVEALFSCFLSNIVLSHLEYFAREDPHARWLQHWSRRPVFARLVRRYVSFSHDSKLLDRLRDAIPNRYALSLMAYFLPVLSTSREGVCSSVSEAYAQGSDQERFQSVVEQFVSGVCKITVFSPVDVSLYGFAIASCACALSSAKCYEYLETTIADVQSCVRRGDEEEHLCWLLRLAECCLRRLDLVREPNARCTEHLDAQLIVLAEALESVNAAAVAAATQSFWMAVLPKYWLPLADHILSYVLLERDMKVLASTFTLTHVIAISRSIEGWLYLQNYFERCANVSNQIPGKELLEQLLQFPMGINSGSSSWRLDHVTFVLLTRWSTYLPFRNALMEAARERCVCHLGVLTKEDDGGLSCLPPIFLESTTLGLQVFEDPPERTLDEAHQHADFIFFRTVFLFLNIFAFSSDSGTYSHHTSTSVTALLLFAESCVDVFLASFSCDNGGFLLSDDMRLYILSLVLLCLLISVQTENVLWRGGSTSLQRMRQIQEVCQSRGGMDPIYLVARFLISGKGRRRLLSILLHGFEANLKEDVVYSVNSFVDDEDYLSQAQCIPDSAAAALINSVIGKAFPHEKERAAGQESLTAFILLWWRITTVDNVLGVEELAALLRLRSLGEWLSFLDKKTRAWSVARGFVSCSSQAYRLLESSSVDILFLSTLCVCNWMCRITKPNKTAGSAIFKASIKLFAAKGLAAWDEWVVHNLTAHVNAVAQEGIAFEGGEWSLPYRGVLPLPSSFFAALIVRPFVLYA